MHLFAALVPPRDVLERVHAVAAAVTPQPEPSDAGAPGRGWRRRRRAEEPPTPTGPPLDLLAPAAMHLPIAKFGNLALSDVTRLAEALEREAHAWESPRLRLAGGEALEPEGDESVWARLSGDLDTLSALARGVTVVAQALHLFVDRRGFRPHIRLGTINDRTSEAYLRALLDALDGFESDAWWHTTLSLVVPAELGPGRPPYKPYRDIPLGPPVPH